MRNRRLKILLFILLTPIVLLCVFLLFERIRGQISVARYKSELISKGEKLDAKDFITTTDAGENGAPEIMAAIKQLKEGKVLPKLYPPKMQLTPAGHAVVGFRENDWIEDKVTNNWTGLAADLETNKATLERIRASFEKPALNNNLDLSQGAKLAILHLSPAKSLTHWFGARSQLALHQGKTQETADDLINQIQLPRLLAEDHIAISELVRIAIAGSAKAATWEAMQADGWMDGVLARMQKAWQDREFISAMAQSMEGERVYCDSTYNLLRKSNDETFHLLYWMEEFSEDEDNDRPFWQKTLRFLPYGKELTDFLKKQIYCRVWRFAWSYQDQRLNLEHMQKLIEITRRATTNNSYADVLPDIERLMQESDKKNWYDKLRYPGPQSVLTLSTVVKRAMRAETERSQCLCAIALKRYSIRHGKAAASLDALVPEFLSSVPIDYMDGKPVRYRLDADGSFTIYSVGEDGKDDGGDTALLPGKTNTRNLWDRKDVVWPSPATPEDVEAYRKEAASE